MGKSPEAGDAKAERSIRSYEVYSTNLGLEQAANNFERYLLDHGHTLVEAKGLSYRDARIEIDDLISTYSARFKKTAETELKKSRRERAIIKVKAILEEFMAKPDQDNSGFGVMGWLAVVVIVLALAGAGWYVFQKDNERAGTTPKTSTPAANTSESITFANPKKGAHFETSTPAHASTLPAVPVDVVIDFNFDLADNSTIRIVKDGKDFGTGTTSIDSSKLAMRRQMDTKAPDGLYKVEYNGCWPDRTCHDGYFQFAINSKLQSSYEDMRAEKSVTIKLSEIKFKPMNILISSDTKVTWVNDDSEQHYVNTDSHPAHTHVPALNSRALSNGQSYSFTFTKTGAYPYHCSAHAADMTGSVVVVES